MKSSLPAVTLLLLCGLFGCIPWHGLDRLPVPAEPALFVDAQTSAPLDEVLVIPWYSAGHGVGSGGGHGPGHVTAHRYLAHPFLYRRDSRFSPFQPKVTGVFFGPGTLFVGGGSSLEGILVAGHGVRPVCSTDLWPDPGTPIRVALTPVSPSGSDDETERLRAMLSGAAPGPIPYGCAGDQPVEVRFTPQEAQMVGRFLAPLGTSVP